MPATDTLRRHVIKSILTQRPEAIANVSIGLWESLAAQLISLIGDGGFISIYTRSVHLTKAAYPWLAICQPGRQPDSLFTDLKISLEAHSDTNAGEASTALLVTFTDILARLIGESLTTSILRSAWGNDAFNIAGKELKQ